MNNQIKVLQTGLRNATGDEPFFVGKTKELEALIKRRDELADLINQRDDSVVAPDQKGKISSDAQYGEMLKAKNIEVQKAISEAAFAEAKVRLNEIERIEREASDKIANARLEMNEKNRREEYRAQTQNLTIFTENEIVIRAEAAEKIKQIRSKERIADKEIAQRSSSSRESSLSTDKYLVQAAQQLFPGDIPAQTKWINEQVAARTPGFAGSTQTQGMAFGPQGVTNTKSVTKTPQATSAPQASPQQQATPQPKRWNTKTGKWE